MNVPVSTRRDCRLCGSPELELVVPLAPSAIADAYIPAERKDELQESFALNLHLCRSCGHVQLLTVIDPGVLFGDYIYETSSSPGLVVHFKRYADEVTERFRLQPGALAVDIGSNDGTLLRFLQEKGLRVLGVDAASEIARKATEAGIPTLGTYFTADLGRSLRGEHGGASLVTANNVFAHADDLGDVAAGVSELLAPDGVFAFEVSYLPDMVENMVFDWVYHEHLCYHTIRPLQAFLGRHGMSLVAVDRISTKGGSIRAVAQRAGGPWPQAASVGEFLRSEEEGRWAEPAPYRAFAARIGEQKHRLLALLREIAADRKTVAGYGASATVTTLIHHFELGGVLSFIVDDNPSRQGLFSPGHHIPVVSPDALYQQRPDYVIVLAWRFADPIVGKHQAYVQQGGRFIVPLPEVTVR